MKNSASSPAVSVIMPAYNSIATIMEAIRSARNQTFRDWELIVVDDGSADGSFEKLSAEIDDRRVRIYRQNNKGVSAARNKGIELSRGTYIAFLDADDLWMKNKLAEQIKFFHDNSAKNPGLTHSAYVEFNHRREYRPRPLKHVKKSEMEGRVSESLAIHNFIGLLTAMVPRSTLENIGGFDESLFAASDWDLWLRIAAKYTIGYIDKPLARYRLNPRGVSKNYEKYEKELWKTLKRRLLESDLPDSAKKRGLWLFYRHMAHGFARDRHFGKSMKRFLKTCGTRPLAAGNLASLAYIAMKFLTGAVSVNANKT